LMWSASSRTPTGEDDLISSYSHAPQTFLIGTEQILHCLYIASSFFFSFYSHSNAATATSDKSPKEVTQEIQAIIRQITASVTFLPLLNEAAVFDLLVYADKQATVPVTWEDSDPCFIANAEQVKLRSFDTKVSDHCSCFSFVVLCCVPTVAFIAIDWSILNGSLSFFLCRSTRWTWRCLTRSMMNKSLYML